MYSQNFYPGGFEDDDDNDFEIYTDDFRNLKVTVIPEITAGAGINGENFNARLSEDLQNWLETYKKLWCIYKATPAMLDKLRYIYNRSQNPLHLALQLFANCPDCNNVKPKSLPYTIIEEIAKLRTEKPEISNNCTDKLRIVAFNFVKTQGILSLYSAINTAYDLHKANHILEEKIRQLIKNHFYKDASYWIVLLGLIDKFNIYDVVLPLIFQDKISNAEEYLEYARNLQEPLVRLLDSLLDRSSSVSKNCNKYISEYNYTDVHTEKLYSKPISKLIIRLVKKYKLPTSTTPHLNRSKSYGYLHHLIRKKYVEKSLNKDSWRELVRDTIEMNEKELQIDLLCGITHNNDLAEAIYWAKYFNLSVDDCPPLVRDAVNAERIKDNDIETYCCKVNKKLVLEEDFYKFELNRNSIIIVNNIMLFEEMIDVLKHANIVGFDSEWKPSFNINNIVNLIQIATHDKVYLIDVLVPEISPELWKKLGQILFNNEEILKLGFSLVQDLTMLKNSLPHLNLLLHSQASYLDLQELWKKLNNITEFKFPYKAKTTNETLSSLVEFCFGKKLDKSNQFSNWEKRPLREEQIIYAALDAYCLLKIFNVIEHQYKQIDDNFEEFVNNVAADTLKKTQKTKKIKQQSHSKSIRDNEIVPPGPNKKTVDVSNVKFLCEGTLEDLAKNLRKCGIDCVVIIDKKHQEECVKIAENECRYLLTNRTNKNFSTLLPPGYCYNVTSDKIEEQLIEVFKYFNIAKKIGNTFSRCKHCNCNEFIIATNDDLRYLIQKNNYEKKTDTICKRRLPDKDCIFLKITSEIRESGLTAKGAGIQIFDISSVVLDNIEKFYICDGCGKCYWDGSYIDCVLNGQLNKIMSRI